MTESPTTIVPAPRHATAGKLALVVTTAIFTSFALLLISIVLEQIEAVSPNLWSIPYHLRFLLVIVWSLLAYAAAPFFGLLAVVGEYLHARQGRGDKPVPTDYQQRIAGRFLAGSLLLTAAVLLPALFLLIKHRARISAGILLDWAAIWFGAIVLVGIGMNQVGRRLARSSGRPTTRLASVSSTILSLTALFAVFSGSRPAGYLEQLLAYSGKTATFSGDSQSLHRTEIVPTLDSPCNPDRNIVWCSSFQLAWNEARDKVIGAPLEVIGAEEIAARLNHAEQSASDIDPGSVYVAAGRIRDGIIGRIEEEMAARFPSYTPPDLSDLPHLPDGILAYSHLTAHVPFLHPFRQVDEGITFIDSQGTQTQVAGFGLWKAYLRRYEELRKQVEILYFRWKAPLSSEGMAEYALDLCRDSEPYQVIIARVEPKGSLAETLEYVRARIADFQKTGRFEDKQFGVNDELRVPEMFWRIDHRFQELIGKTVVNSDPPMPIFEALQTIEFRLDRSGAILESDSMLRVLSLPRHFEFNRPFLVYMQKRGAEHPFFVMWVDNAELLVQK